MNRADPLLPRFLVLCLAGCSPAPDRESEARPETAALESSGMVVTRGIAQERGACSVTIDCQGDGNNREALCGTITAEDGSRWAVPGPASDGATLLDIYNECSLGGDNPDFESELATTVLNDDGEVVTASLFADNYFEFYVNGNYMGRDAVGFTPFNSHAARYQVDYPVTYALLLVDWEGYLGIGLEDQSVKKLHIGDGGFIAAFSDGAASGTEWVCRNFYIAPLDDPNCIVVDENGNPDSSGCPSTDEAVSCRTADPESSCRAAHFALPDNWMTPDYDDSGWLPATTYTADEVTASPGFRNYEDTLFQGAEFIWTSNLNLDNLVVCRTTVEPRRAN